MLIGKGRNQYGTEISIHRCDQCENIFTVCPPVDDAKWGGCCLSPICESYNPFRDVDFLMGWGLGKIEKKE